MNYFDANPYTEPKLVVDPIERASLDNSLNFSGAKPATIADPYAKFESTAKPDFSKSELSSAAPEVDAHLAQSNSAAASEGLSAGAKSGVAGAALNMAQGGDAESALSAGLISSGNPYAMGAGLALGAFSANQKKQYAYEVAQAQANTDQRKSMEQSARKNQEAYYRMKNLVG